MSRYDSQFAVSGDSALESPAAAKIDDWKPVSITQFTVYPLSDSTSNTFPNSTYAVVQTSNYIDPRFQDPRLIIRSIPNDWPFARIGIRFRGYFEPCPPVPNHTLYPSVMDEPMRILIPARRYSSFGSPSPPDGWRMDDDWKPINYGGPGPVELIDRIAFYSSPSLDLNVFGSSPYIFGVAREARLDQRWPGSPWLQYGGRLDPANDPLLFGVEAISYFQRNLLELNNLTGVEFHPGRQPNEQRLVITLYEPQREDEWRPTEIVELDPS